jgi:hypothetical protein
MRRSIQTKRAWILACGTFFFLLPSPADAQFGPMSCIECHTDPAAGGVHGGFRALTNLTDDQIDAMCMSCHDGSYTNPQGVDAPEAAVHQNKNPGEERDEYGDFKAGCRDCHTNHSPLLAGDGTANPNLKMLGLKVNEASSSDGIARIRKPVILDVNGNNGGSSNSRFEDDVQTGWECDTGVPDDPTCIETDPPDAGDGVRKLAFYQDIDTAGTHWVSTAPPYIGACNTCHTRSSHHRRDDSGGDHDHNADRNCDDCHNHKDGWVNKGG